MSLLSSQTPMDKQDLLCGQLAGVGRCVSELSSSAVRILRLRRCKFAIRMKDDFFWVRALQRLQLNLQFFCLVFLHYFSTMYVYVFVCVCSL